jgi:Putative auto-transporter adhesin, head GIN domain
MRMAHALLFLALGPGLFGSGMTEDDQDPLTRTWEWDGGADFELRGQVEFTVVPGPRLRVTVQANRALFDQLSVGHWWGKTSVVVESGLRGPREPGKVVVTIETPEIRRLEVANSRGTVEALGLASLAAWEGSAVTVKGQVSPLTVEASWGSSVVLEGRFPTLSAKIESQAWVDTRKAEIGQARVWIHQSSYLAGSTEEGTATLKEGGRLEADRRPWTIVED